MAIKLPQGFDILSKAPVDVRLVLTKEQMRDSGETLKKVMPEKYFAVCKDDGEFYIYDKLGEFSEETGYFHSIGLKITPGEEGQILMFHGEEWVPVDFTDENSVIYLDNEGLSIKGYKEAKQGQMLVKDSVLGLTWIDPISDAQLQQAVAAAERSANAAANQATAAGNSAIDANTAAKTAQRINEQTLKQINDKFWWGSLEEYNKLETITEGTFYFIQV